MHLEWEGIGFKSITIVFQEGNSTFQRQSQHNFLVNTTIAETVISEAAYEILIKQQLLCLRIDIYIVNIACRTFFEIVYSSLTV